MLDPAVLPGFVAAVVLVTVAPGPDNAFIAAVALDRGARAGLLSAVWMALCMVVHVTATALGLALVLRSAPAALDVVRRRARAAPGRPDAARSARSAAFRRQGRVARGAPGNGRPRSTSYVSSVRRTLRGLPSPRSGPRGAAPRPRIVRCRAATSSAGRCSRT